MKLSFKISLLASLVSIFFILIIFTNTQHRIIGESKQHIIEDYSRHLLELQNSFNLILQKSTNTISLLSLMRTDVIKKENKTLKKKFEMAIKDVSSINKITLLSLEGEEIIVSSKNRLFEKPNKNNPYLNKQVLDKISNGQIHYSNIYFDTQSNEMMINIAKMVKSPTTQKYSAILLLEISLEDMKEVITNKLTNGNGIALINSNNNQFIYKSTEINNINTNLLLKQHSTKDYIQFITQKDNEYLLVSKNYKYDALQIKFVILNNTDNIFAHINKTFTINILILFIILIILALIMFTFIDYSFKPLTQLLTNIKELSHKISANKKVPSTKGMDEVNSIKIHFDFFVKLISEDRDKLNNYNTTLEERIAEEVAKNKEQERTLAHQAKMAALGEMIGNIAHQWRQPLSIISTMASGIQMEKKLGSFKEENLEEQMGAIVDQTQYLSKTIDDFRDFIKDKGSISTFSTVEMINKITSLVSSSLKNNYIKLHTQFDYDTKIAGYENELIQAFINILNNSKDAIKSNTEQTDKRVILLKTKQVENGIKISITDNGGGIPKEIIDKIFEPYFTTKHKSIGTGIGLSMVDQIIRERNEGKISVENVEFTLDDQSFKGACFSVIFSSASNEPLQGHESK